MSGFRFRLATVMKLRQRARDERRAELAKAFTAEAVLQEKMDELSVQLDGVRNMVRDMSCGGVLDVDKLLSARRHEIQLHSQRRDLLQHAQRLATEIVRRRTALVDADRDVRVLEKLSEKQLAEFELVQQKDENKYLDEIASQQFQPNED